jgi:hypothetical protein
LKGLEEDEEESWKYNPNMEWDKYEIGQNIIAMETTNKKVRQCSQR